MAGALGCQSADTGTAGCEITHEIAAPASPLGLLPDVALQRVGAGLALVGADADGATARWATVDPAAPALGPEAAAPILPGAAGPWLVLASDKAPGDTLLSAIVVRSGSDAELHLGVVPTVAPPQAASALGPAYAVSHGALAPGVTPMVALGASRAGPHAALAWVDPAAGAVMELALSAGGEPLGDPTVVDQAPVVRCLGFAAGKGAMTLVYYKLDAATSNTPHYLIRELRDTGDLDSSLELTLDSHAGATCPQLAPTDAGYAIAFQDSQASWLVTYDDATQSFTEASFASAVAAGGAALQPPLAGLAPMGSDFGVILEGTQGGDLWRVSSGGARRDGHLSLPTAHGIIGHISSQGESGSLTATYADYSAPDHSGGRRYVLTTSCR
jgi:hypothetical protein